MSNNKKGSLFYSRGAVDLDQIKNKDLLDFVSDGDSSEDEDFDMLFDKKRKGNKSKPVKKQEKKIKKVVEEDLIEISEEGSDDEDFSPKYLSHDVDTALEIPELALADITLRQLEQLKHNPTEKLHIPNSKGHVPSTDSFSILVRMPCGLKTLVFKLDKSKKLKSILEYIISLDESLNYCKDDLVFMLHSMELDLEQTCEEAEIIDNDELFLIKKKNPAPEHGLEMEEDDGKIVLHVRVNENRDPLKYKIAVGDPLSKIVDHIAKDNSVSVSAVILKFDGDVLTHNSTPEDHGLENEDLIDAIIKS